MEVQEKETKKNKKEKKGWGCLGSTIAIILLLSAMGGCFDKAASEITDGAYGSGEDVYEYEDTGNQTQKTGDTKSEVKELSEYVDLAEDKLIEELGVEKSVTGYYPNDNNINFICMEGKVYGISLSVSHENKDKGYTLFGVAIGDDAGEELYNQLTKEFDFLSSATVDGGLCDMYSNKENGYSLSVEYNSALEITAINYVAEISSVPQETQVQEETTENVALEKYQILPNYTYYSQSTDGITMYMNLSENTDGSINVEGFAYDYSNNLIEDLCFEAKFVCSEENWYTSEDGIYDMVISDDCIEVMESWFDEEPEILFCGTFYLIVED